MKSNPDGLISFADHDNDNLVVIHTKSMLIEEKLRQENRHLLEMNRRLEQQKDESKAKFELLNHKSEEYINKVKTDVQVRPLRPCLLPLTGEHRYPTDVFLRWNPLLAEPGVHFRFLLRRIKQPSMN